MALNFGTFLLSEKQGKVSQKYVIKQLFGVVILQLAVFERNISSGIFAVYQHNRETKKTGQG
ncbi:MAG: hypothetical protein J5676_13590 [Bacteroidaceae bacterium]|nr:hypothetical protein [Bacteroidaceae bacterium]